ncbi:hypothetical protein E8E13_006300 [Curvularia kusanoi]|uniref:Tryptophan synthase beta chain-like PALP domain-containing protein n=1 Tax=Curvularia kusanoi TaxID=90978 RepID=A0A9P4WAQ3_CURKU|nr:hypothetical protein E8E13_006300 [Curvularia kusanoi]
MASLQKSIYFNSETYPIEVKTDFSIIRKFHQELPHYSRTPLVCLKDVATQLKVKSVFVKDESARLGLPAFKILGASWGSCRAIIARTGIPVDSSLAQIAQAAQDEGIILFTASAGNHGRALAAMAKILGIQAQVYVPRTVHDEAVRLIRSEGAKVIVSVKDYDGAMLEAFEQSSSTENGLFVQDTAFEGYEEIPTWIVEGYSTLLGEIEEQLEEKGLRPHLVITPVGVGSLAHAVVRHCKSGSRQCAVLSVEPESAACLYESMVEGAPKTVSTAETIMEGMNCGTLSSAVFGDLKRGVDACATVSDLESHQAVQYLSQVSVNSGPCGSAALAALQKLSDTPAHHNLLSQDSVVVILNTEGLPYYNTPPTI